MYVDHTFRRSRCRSFPSLCWKTVSNDATPHVGIFRLAAAVRYHRKLPAAAAAAASRLGRVVRPSFLPAEPDDAHIGVACQRQQKLYEGEAQIQARAGLRVVCVCVCVCVCVYIFLANACQPVLGRPKTNILWLGESKLYQGACGQPPLKRGGGAAVESGLKVLSGLEIQSGRALCNFREHGGDALEHFRYMCVDDACMYVGCHTDTHGAPNVFFFARTRGRDTSVSYGRRTVNLNTTSG